MNVGVALGGVVAGLIASVAHPGSFTVLFLIDVRDLRRLPARARALVRASPALHAERAAAGAGAPSSATGRRHAFTLLNATFMTPAISLVVELLPGLRGRTSPA